MKKFKWVIQDENGAIWKFELKRSDAGGAADTVSQPLDKAVTPIRINLKKNGILLKLPRDYYNKKTCDLMMRAWRLIIRSETGER